MGNNIWVDVNGQIHQDHSSQHRQDFGKRTEELGKINEDKSIMKRFPEFNFLPASLVHRSGRAGWWILYVFVSLVMIFLFVISLIAIIEDEMLGGSISLLVISVVLIVLWNILFYKRELWHHPHGGHKKLINEADYVSGKRGLCIFVKNNRFGLIKLWSFKVFVPPIYEYMEWEIPKQLLRVTKEGRTFLIDIYNNEV